MRVDTDSQMGVGIASVTMLLSLIKLLKMCWLKCVFGTFQERCPGVC